MIAGGFFIDYENKGNAKEQPIFLNIRLYLKLDIMWMVKTEYPDYTKLDNKGRILLNADQNFNPYKWNPPINWKGFVSGIEVEFTQINSTGSNKIDYDFSSLPKECVNAIPYIVEAIDNAMKVMD